MDAGEAEDGVCADVEEAGDKGEEIGCVCEGSFGVCLALSEDEFGKRRAGAYLRIEVLRLSLGLVRLFGWHLR